MEDEELFSTFNDALDILNLESDQAVTRRIRHLLADLDISGDAASDNPVSALIEELPNISRPIHSRRK